MRLPVATLLTCMLALLAPVARAAINPLVASYGSELDVIDVSVTVQDGLIPRESDRQAKSYIESRLTAEQQSAFDRSPRGWNKSEDSAAERLAEFLGAADLQAVLAGPGGQRRVRLVIDVREARFPMVRVPLMPTMPGGGSRFGGTYKVLDAETGAMLAQGSFADSEGALIDRDAVRKRLNLKFLNLGRDDHIQVLADVVGALSRNFRSLLRDESFPTGRLQTGSMTIGGAIPVTVTQTMGFAAFTVELQTKEGAN